MIYLDPQITFSQALRIAERADCQLLNDDRGNLVITPRTNDEPSKADAAPDALTLAWGQPA